MNCISLKNIYLGLKSYVSNYNFTITDDLSVIKVAIFKITNNKENDIFIGTFEIPYEECLANNWYFIEKFLKKAIYDEELSMDK